jgi:hypothetical protein
VQLFKDTWKFHFYVMWALIYCASISLNIRICQTFLWKWDTQNFNKISVFVYRIRRKVLLCPSVFLNLLCFDMTEYRNWATLFRKCSISDFKKPVQCFRCINNVTVKHVDKMTPHRALIRQCKNNAWKWNIFFC